MPGIGKERKQLIYLDELVDGLSWIADKHVEPGAILRAETSLRSPILQAIFPT